MFAARRLAAAVACSVPLVVATAPHASAALARDLSGSVVFIRSHNVFIARPDGSHVRRLTRDGRAGSSYRLPSEDNGGHIIAIRKTAFYRLDQRGRVLQHFAIPTRGVNLGVNFASVSPDGTKIAFSWTTTVIRSGTTYAREVLAYSSATRSRRLGAGTGQDIAWASWVNNSRTVLGGVDNDVYYKDVRSAAHRWYHDCDPTTSCPQGDGVLYNNFYPAVNRQGTVYASAIVDTGYARATPPWPTYFNLLDTRNFGSGRPGYPTKRCSWSMAAGARAQHPGPDDSPLQTLSFSPRGASLVFAYDKAGSWGVYRVDGVASLATCSISTTKILSNAAQVRWSPAPLR